MAFTYHLGFQFGLYLFRRIENNKISDLFNQSPSADLNKITVKQKGIQSNFQYVPFSLHLLLMCHIFHLNLTTSY